MSLGKIRAVACQSGKRPRDFRLLFFDHRHDAAQAVSRKIAEMTQFRGCSGFDPWLECMAALRG